MNWWRRYLRFLYRRKPLLFALLVGGAVLAFGGGVFGGVAIVEAIIEEPPAGRPWEEIVASGTLRAVTVSSSTSAFRYKGGWRGHEYEMGQQVARSLGLRLDVMVAPDVPAMLDSVKTGVADVALWPVAAEERQRSGGLRACGHIYNVRQVLIGKKKMNLRWADTAVYTLCVLDGSRQQALLDADTTGALPYDRLRVVAISQDSIQGEELVDWVDEGRYDLTMVEENRAQLYLNYYGHLKASPPLPDSDGEVSWVVAEGADSLAARIDALPIWGRGVPRYTAVMKRYYENGRGKSVAIRYLLGNGRLSVYDSLYRAHAVTLGWDWRLLAAISYVESRFDPYAVSYKGALGLMQLMPTTAEAFGCPPEMANDPESNVAAGTRLLDHLQTSLRNKLARIGDPAADGYATADSIARRRVDASLIYYIIGSFHAGLGHVFDAITMADSLGYDPLAWAGNVEQCLIMKADPDYYNLPYVRLGKFSGEITAEYIDEVLEAYESFQNVASL